MSRRGRNGAGSRWSRQTGASLSDLVWVPDELLVGLDQRQRLLLGLVLCDISWEDEAGLELLLDEPTGRCVDEVLAWFDARRCDLPDRAFTERIVIAGIRISAQAVGWCSDEEITAEFAASRDVKAVARLLADRHAAAGAWAAQMDA